MKDLTSDTQSRLLLQKAIFLRAMRETAVQGEGGVFRSQANTGYMRTRQLGL